MRDMSTLLKRLRHEEDGLVTVFVIGCLVFVLGLIFVVASASAIHLDRKALAGAADALAVSAANAEVRQGYYDIGNGRAPNSDGPRELTHTEVQAAVDQHLAENPSTLDGLGVTSVETYVEGSETAVVRLTARVQLPLTGWILEPWEGGITITAEARARAW